MKPLSLVENQADVDRFYGTVAGRRFARASAQELIEAFDDHWSEAFDRAVSYAHPAVQEAVDRLLDKLDDDHEPFWIEAGGVA